MKSIRIVVSAVRDGEVVSGVIMKQRKKGDAWTSEEAITVVSSDPGADRTFVLDDDQRLIIEGKSDMHVVFDRDQFSSRIEKGPAPTATPTALDGDESPKKPAIDLAQEPGALSEAAAQERRDAAVTAARQTIKKNQPPKAKTSAEGDED